MQQIYLIRHITPRIGNPSCNYLQAITLLEQYNNTESLNFEELQIAPQIPHLPIYCSPLPRARLTAKNLFPNTNITFDVRLKGVMDKIVAKKWVKALIVQGFKPYF